MQFLCQYLANVKVRTTIVASLVELTYEGWSKIFRTDAVKIIKLTISPISRRHPRSSSLQHVDTSPTFSFIFGTLPGSPFLSECQALSVIRPGSPHWYRTGVLSASISFLEIGRSHRVPSRGSMVGGDNSNFVFRQKLVGEDGSVRWGIVMVKQPGLFLPKLGEMSSHFFTQSPQNFAVEPGIHSLACWNKFFVHNPLVVKESDDHALEIAFHLSDLF